MQGNNRISDETIRVYGDIETGKNLNIQLYNLKEDTSQLHNLVENHPQMVKTMLKEIEIIQNKE